MRHQSPILPRQSRRSRRDALSSSSRPAAADGVALQAPLTESIAAADGVAPQAPLTESIAAADGVAPQAPLTESIAAADGVALQAPLTESIAAADVSRPAEPTVLRPAEPGAAGDLGRAGDASQLRKGSARGRPDNRALKARLRPGSQGQRAQWLGARVGLCG